MLFLNATLLLGLLGVSIPIILHIFNRKSAKALDWGAMRFLLQSMASRTRRIELEDALLMAARCLLFGALAMALARPFSPPGSPIPWAAVLPVSLVAIAAFGVSFAVWQNRKLRWSFLITSLVLFALVGAAILFEREWNLRRLSGGGDQDVALIIDASTSMTAEVGGKTLFDRAVGEAREIVNGSGRATAFSLILAGPSPVVLNSSPRTNRGELDQLLGDARPSDGAMALTEALREASVQLSKGERGGKRVVLITDGQAFGWNADNAAAWAFVKDGFADMPEKPQMILRRMETPAEARNIAVTEIAFGRDSIGTDRAVEVQVTLENTGTEAVTPGGVQLRAGDTLLEDNSLGQLVPGLRQTVRFEHHFKTPGAHAVTARALVEDNIGADNSLSRAVTVLGGMKVLIVDGNPGGRFFDRASAFLSIALAPGMAEGAPFLIEPDVIPAPQVLSLTSFDDYGAVVLADVQRLPANIASLLAKWVGRGGGLLITPGRRAESEFYNNWSAGPGKPVAPATLDELAQIPPDTEPPVGPSLSTFNHRALRKAADAKAGDLSSWRLGSYWKLAVPEADRGASAIAKLNTGEPLLAARKLGSGTVFLSCCPFDNKSSNLATRNSFLPFIHEIVYYLADPDGGGLNLPPGASISLRLPADLPPAPADGETSEPPRFGVLDPRGETRAAAISASERGVLAEVPGDAMAGLYEMEIPTDRRGGFDGMLTAEGTVPFTVGRPADESRLTPLTGAQLGFVSGYFDLLQPEKPSEVLTILAGKSFGEELWKYLAVGVLFLLLVEAALARWIARARKTGSRESVEFESRKGPGRAFLKQLGKLKKEAA